MDVLEESGFLRLAMTHARITGPKQRNTPVGIAATLQKDDHSITGGKDASGEQVVKESFAPECKRRFK
jgi:hypothetical protein